MLTRKRPRTGVLKTTEIMDPEPLVKAIIDLARAQLKLGELLATALFSLEKRPVEVRDRPESSASTDDKCIERAATAIEHEMLRHKDVGFASLLRMNLPPDEIRRIAKAAIEAARGDVGGSD